jgi:hypothetical protein
MVSKPRECASTVVALIQPHVVEPAMRTVSTRRRQSSTSSEVLKKPLAFDLVMTASPGAGAICSGMPYAEESCTSAAGRRVRVVVP